MFRFKPKGKSKKLDPRMIYEKYSSSNKNKLLDERNDKLMSLLLDDFQKVLIIKK